MQYLGLHLDRLVRDDRVGAEDDREPGLPQRGKRLPGTQPAVLARLLVLDALVHVNRLVRMQEPRDLLQRVLVVGAARCRACCSSELVMWPSGWG